MQKKNIAVIFGGKSSEHEVSRVSAYYVISSIPKDKYNIYTIGIKKDGKWLLDTNVYDLLKDFRDGIITSDVLGKVLAGTSNHMKNAYARSDA